MRGLFSAFLVLIVVSGQAHGQGGATVSYQPPILPISVSVNDRGNVQFELTGSVQIPFVGTFSTGISKQNIDIEPNNTYFLIRTNETEQLYCIGIRGKIRLKASGEHVIELSNFKDYNNVIVVDIRSLIGTVDIEFLPDNTLDYIAKASGGGSTDILLKKDGTVFIDQFGWSGDQSISKSKLKKAVFLDMPLDKASGIIFEFAENGNNKSSHAVVFNGQRRIEALWLRECLKRLDICKVEDAKLKKSYKDCIRMFESGGVMIKNRGNTLNVIREPEFIFRSYAEFKDKQISVDFDSVLGLLQTGRIRLGDNLDALGTQYVSVKEQEQFIQDVREHVNKMK